MHVDELGAELRVEDGLAAVQAAVAGQHIADGAGHGEVQHALRTEHLHTQHHRGDGAVHRAAEHGHKADGGGEGGGQAQQRAHPAAEGGAHEEGRHYLTALEAAADGNGGEQQLQKPRPTVGLSVQRPLDHVHTRAVIVRGAQQQGQGDDDHAARRRPEVAVLYQTGRQMLRDVQAAAEQDAHQCAEDGQHQHQQHRPRIQRRHGHGEAGGGHAQQQGDEISRHGGGDAGHQPRVVQHAHADDLQREHGGGEGGAEQSGEHAAHAAQRGQRQILLSQMQQSAGAVADAAADLQGRALAAGAAAAQVGDDGGDEDQRHQQHRYVGAEVYRFDDGVGALALQFT